MRVEFNLFLFLFLICLMDPCDGSAISGTLKWEALKTSQKMGTSEWETYYNIGSHQGSSASLFSSSLPVLPHEKLITDSCIGVHSIDDIASKLDELDVKNAIEEFDLQGIGNLLPDEDELFDGILSDYNQCTLPSLEQVEDCDLFSSGGGIELDVDPMENVVLGIAKPSTTDGYVGNGNFSYNIANSIGSIAGEHPYGEHPSRTLFVRNINSNVEDSELRSLFEQYGDIRSMYTTCKHRGFVMISYFDIRHARSAMRALQDKPLRRRKLDIHFSIPKDNPSEKDLNQGTLVVFNLDPSVSNDDLRQIFGAFGEVKEIRETPHKKHHKFVEFYDVRAAEDALRSLNRSDIAGKRIKLEPSRPGGARRSLIQQLSPVDNEDMKNYRHQIGSPITNSPPGHWNHSSTWSGGNTVNITHSSEFTSMNSSFVSSSAKISPIGIHRTNRGDLRFSKTYTCRTMVLSFSLIHSQSTEAG
ncbi:hypothetical protein HPP92_024731 [Vanilla planifolia]|uniref:RRM domain-containing protein n=1 Tax=Vanilla planifolia TaxID=51239 RepID=A0A835UA71_VANPL|nr:hypothetical protein HPP92_024731 [Vanilla planifolia]